MSFFRCGSQTTAPYSRMGLISDKYAFRLQDLGQCLKFLLMKPSDEFAFFVQLPMWFDHVRSSVKRMPM